MLTTEDMDLDALGVAMIQSGQSARKRHERKSHRITKKKPRNQVIFPSEVARRKKKMGKKSKK
jgi:hypothetical protein